MYILNEEEEEEEEEEEKEEKEEKNSVVGRSVILTEVTDQMFFKTAGAWA